MLSDQTSRYREARQAVERRRALQIFVAHLAVFLVGNAFLGGWNAVTYYVTETGFIWFPLPLLFWGIGVIIHYWTSIVLFDRWWERDEAVISEMLGLPPQSETGRTEKQASA